MKGNFEMPKRKYDSGSESSNESGSESDKAKKLRIGKGLKTHNFLQQYYSDQAVRRSQQEEKDGISIDTQERGKRKARDSSSENSSDEDFSDEKNKGHKKEKLEGDVEKMRALDTMYKQVMQDMKDLQIANKGQEKIQAIN